MLVTLVAQWYKPVMSFLGKIHDLSLEYPDVVFAIIDMDESRDLVRHIGMIEQPGMRLYLRGEKATEFSGINVFNNPPELDTILRFELEKRGAKRVDVVQQQQQQQQQSSIIQQAIQLARPGGAPLKLRPTSTDSSSSVDSPHSTLPSSSPFPFKYFAILEYQLFSTASNMSLIESKILSFSDSIPACKLDSNQLSTLKALILVLSDDSRYSSSNFEEGQLELLTAMLETWPVENLFPVLDLFRLALLHPIGRAFFLHSPIIPRIIDTAKTAPFPYQFMAFKSISNLFDSRITKQLVINLFESVLSLCSHLASSSNKNLQLAMSTLLLNYSTFLMKEGIDDSVYTPAPLINVIKDILSQTSSLSDDALFRICVALANVHLNSKASRETIASLLPSIQKHAEQLKTTTPPITEHTSLVVSDLSTMTSSSS